MAANNLRASFALAVKNAFHVFSHGTCWGFRSPIPRITLRFLPRFLPAAVTVLISQSKGIVFISPQE